MNVNGNLVVSGGIFYMTFTSYTISTDLVTLTRQQCEGALNYLTAPSATTVNLPAVSACSVGSYMTIYGTTAFVVTIDPFVSDRIRLNGVALADGVTIISGGEVGNYIALHNDSADGWTVVGRSGYWAGGA